MANQHTIQRVLSQAHDQNLIAFSSKKNPCLLQTINTANSLLFLLEQSQGQGLDNEQLEKRSGLNLNTIKVYMRVLAGLGYVVRSEAANKSPIGAGGFKAVWHLKE